MLTQKLLLCINPFSPGGGEGERELLHLSTAMQKCTVGNYHGKERGDSPNQIAGSKQ